MLQDIRTDWSLFAGKSYLPVRLTQFSRGCINMCEYCATGNIYKQSHRCRPVEQMLEEHPDLVVDRGPKPHHSGPEGH